LRKLNRREIALLGVVGAAVLVVLGVRLFHHAEATPAAGTPSHDAEIGPAIARIDLARLDAPHPEAEAGRRNLFDFGSLVRDDPEPAPIVVATPHPIATPPPSVLSADGSLATPAPPPLNLKYIGSVENATGVKAAILITDKKEVLIGQAGQVVANRYRVARIGLESVDLEDVASGQSRRLPMRAQ
jgi:hypothetical protein